MIHSEWICNTYDQDFRSKGKKDNHKESQHRQSVVLILSDQEEKITRAENGKFACLCGKEFSYVQSLKRYRIDYTASVLMIENEEDEDTCHSTNFRLNL